MISQYIRKDLRQFKPYHAPIVPYALKLDANENPFEQGAFLDQYINHLSENSQLLTRYPDTDNLLIRQRIALKYQIQPENVTIGVGSDQLIDCILRVFIDPGDQVMAPYPSFSMYYLSTRLNHGIPLIYELDENFDYNINEMLEIIEREQPKCIFICRPNNPTGNSLSQTEIKQILSSTDKPVIVDEAYAEFLSDSMVSCIDEYPNLIVLRTFSKAYGLAGLRLGYAIGCTDAIECINITKPPYNVNALSQSMGITVLEHESFYNEQINQLIKERERVMTAIVNSIHVEKVYPSEANFLLLRLKNAEFINRFKEQNILVRAYGNDRRLENCIRLTIGTPDENNRIIQLLNM